MKTLTLILISVFLIIGGTTLKSMEVGEMAPDFSLENLDGEKLSLSDYNGKIVFLFLLGDQCPYCLSVGPATEELYQKYMDNEDFVALGLDLWDGTKFSMENFRSQTGITYDLLLKAKSVGTSYNSTYDRAIVIDRDGIIRHKGATVVSNDLNNVDEVISSLLEGEATDIDDNFGVQNHLDNIFPNPVRDFATLNYSIAEREYAKITIYNSLGQVIDVPLSEMLKSGEHILNLETRNYTRGVYYYQLKVGEFVVTKKFVVER